ncbi:hypothetical protein EV693_10363 [Nicoletella semolina]|uniref:Uncharacterized protein n=1 Tax=Nicoletella semolina TaxID=271160 RepID=A0A4R2NAQ4_9PAST|nr:hypothetical protein [Nicoletella semolina]MDH2923971.1 hypothetical protein [Nicoletella semolina]TCP18098.1 hypothetical protein EV693_10363 [Nicoletella semolina]
MNHFNYHFKPLLIAFIAILFFAIVLEIVEDEPIPSTPTLAVEDNFNATKIWTEYDFQQAEIDPLDISYHDPCQTACPDNLTADDLALLQQHYQKQIQRLTAGGQ